MLQVDLERLRRVRATTLQGAIAPSSEAWNDSELRFAGAVEVGASVAATAEGGVIVRGSWRSSIQYECGRCLADLDVVVEGPLSLVYVSGMEWGADDPDVRTLGDQGAVLDLTDAIREEVLLAVPRYHVPREVAGRCTACDQPTRQFSYVADEPGDGIDPRWSALKALQEE